MSQNFSVLGLKSINLSTFVNIPEEPNLVKSKDDGHLQQKTVIDKNGHQKKVWITTGEQTKNGYEYVRPQDDEEKTIQAIIDHPTHSQSDKIRNLFTAGVTDKKTIADLTGAHYSRVCTLVKDMASKVGMTAPANDGNTDPEQSNQQANAIADNPKKALPQVSVDEKWDMYDMFAEMVIEGEAKCGVFYGRGGTGKAQSVFEKVLMSDGSFKNAGEVIVGDKVIAPNGKIANILKTYPHPMHDLYRVKVADGSSLLVGADHNWLVWDKTSSWNKETKKRQYSPQSVVLTTKQMVDKNLKLRSKSISANGTEIPAEWRFMIPFSQPIEQGVSIDQLPIHPYILGVILGDGCLVGGKPRLTIGVEDQEQIISKVNSLLPSGTFLAPLKCDTGIEFQFETDSNDTMNFVREVLRDLQLFAKDSWSKFIPQIYLQGNLEARTQLLQGLMDTDGSVSKTSMVYYTVSEQLANDFNLLALSFGRNSSVSKVKRQFSGLAKESRESKGIYDSVSECFEIHFQTPREIQPVSLLRKAEKWSKKAFRDNIRGKSIVSIEFETVQDAVCFEVDSEDNTYIATNYLVTHNTYGVSQQLKSRGMIPYDEDVHTLGADDYDYVSITGKSTTTAVYAAMFEHNGKLIIFDDCDSAIHRKNEDTANLLKGALDTSGNGTVAYGGISQKTMSNKGIPDDKQDGVYRIPKRFKFGGRMMFISNLGKEDMPSPIIDSRALSIDLSMTASQTIDRLKKIVHVMPITDVSGNDLPNISTDDRNEAVDFLDQYKDSIKLEKINGRTLGSIIKLKKAAERNGRDWKTAALILIGG